LFVYGTLREGAGHPMFGVLSCHAELVGAAKVAGRIYEVRGFPGLVVGEEGEMVVGEVYKVLTPEVVWKELDAYEGVAEGFYTRELFKVIECEGVDEAWVYVFARSVEGLNLIESGDYLRGGS